MKKYLIFLSFFIAGIIYTGCDSGSNSVGNEDNPPDNANYFPGNQGNYYKYSVAGTDSAGQPVSGMRSTTYNGTIIRNGETFQIQIDSLFNGITTVSNSYFRINENTDLEYFLDTTGFYQFIPSGLPITISVDTKLLLLSLPLYNGLTWTVFRISYSGLISGTAIQITGNYLGKEDIGLSIGGGNAQVHSAAKMRFTLSITIPEIGGPGTGVNRTMEAFAWLVADIGIVKWQGNGTIVNAFTTGGIDFDDSTSTVTHTLVDYKVN